MSGIRSNSIRIGAVYSGISYQQKILDSKEYQKRINKLPVCDLPKMDLSTYNVLIFPRGTDQEVVYSVKDKIEELLNLGNMVISFGEVTKEWLPSCRWDGVKPEDDGPLLIKKEHPIFKNLKPEDLHWHKGATGWCCHGHFIAPPGAEVLVTNCLGDPVMYIDCHSTKGIILAASQLDVICHAAGENKGAKILFGNIIKWAINEVRKLKEVNKNG